MKKITKLPKTKLEYYRYHLIFWFTILEFFEKLTQKEFNIIVDKNFEFFNFKESLFFDFKESMFNEIFHFKKDILNNCFLCEYSRMNFCILECSCEYGTECLSRKYELIITYFEQNQLKLLIETIKEILVIPLNFKQN